MLSGLTTVVPFRDSLFAIGGSSENWGDRRAMVSNMVPL
jgi:hypothetical protein